MGYTVVPTLEIFGSSGKIPDEMHSVGDTKVKKPFPQSPRTILPTKVLSEEGLQDQLSEMKPHQLTRLLMDLAGFLMIRY